jgi:hypothetical protein
VALDAERLRDVSANLRSLAAIPSDIVEIAPAESLPPTEMRVVLLFAIAPNERPLIGVET